MIVMAWAGAGLFLASLMYFAYFYLVVLGRITAVAADAVPAALATNVGLFTIFALHHSLLARAGAKRLVARLAPPAVERTAYVWLASSLFLGVCLLWRPLPGVAWEASGMATWLLRSLQLAGAALTLASASRIDIWELAGVRQVATARVEVHRPAEASTASGRAAQAAPTASASVSPSPGSAAPLEVAGPYRWLRHPIYLGWVLLVFGSPLMTSGRLLFATISTAYLVVAIPFEERALMAEFGTSYRDYQRQVRWRLVPGIW